MAPEETLILLDGPAILFRCFYAIPPLSNRAGIPTNVVVGFYTTLRRLLGEHRPALAAVAMDRPEPTFRHLDFPEYKANRPEPPSDLIRQIPYVRALCAALRVPVLEQAGFEADDVLGTCAREAAARGLRVILVSTDKDLLQLVTDRVLVLNPVTNRLLDSTAVESAFGVRPDQVADVLALWGDAADNVPGVPGIGEKGAKTLIRRFGTLEACLRRASEVPRRGYREGLQRFGDRALRARSLVTIRTDVPLAVEFESLRRADPDPESLGALLRELEIAPRGAAPAA